MLECEDGRKERKKERKQRVGKKRKMLECEDG